MGVLTNDSTKQLIASCMSASQSRIEFWAEFIHHTKIQRMVEVGVWKGDFAVNILQRCDCVNKYFMVDPWRHLDNWNKPANQNDALLDSFYEMTKARTEFAKDRRVILRGKTTEVIDQIKDGELDFAYIDGDHTLKGIAIDMVRVYPKIRTGGFLGGDDFSRTIWSHRTSFEPTLVFPFAVYFAEAVGATIYSLPNIQFLLHKTEQRTFGFVDLVGQYDDLSLRSHVTPEKMIRLFLGEKFPRLLGLFRKIRQTVSS
ncbi:MAG TPA: class I SAM-dependent methyltransferase [Terriglobales bacterium]|nr:class I SAM-dependent methyltransferase [Terriglobales bacterium]